MNVLGMDIGYSNLKLAHGAKDTTPTTVLRPAGAAPSECFSSRFDGRKHEDCLYVTVNDKEFIAGVPADRAEMYSRSLHADYPASDPYRALFHAGLLLSAMDTVDVLVTGLPVSQYLDENRREALAKQMRGEHQVTAKRKITVKKVKVIPQPVGGLLDYVTREGADIDDANVLVIDPGFFSVDWVVVANNDINRKSSDTSLEASSVVLEEVARLVAKDYGAVLSTETVENAVRAGKTSVMVLGERVELRNYIEAASKTIAPNVVQNIKKALRRESKDPDMIVLVGGGAMFFRDAVQNLYPRIKVHTPTDSVFANARGFWTMGAVL